MRKLLLSLFSGATIAFVLLILMAQLVAFRGERPTVKPPQVVDTVTPEKLPPEKKPNKTEIPPKPVVRQAPQGLPPPIDTDKEPIVVTDFPDTPRITEIPTDWTPVWDSKPPERTVAAGMLRAIRQLQPMYPIDARERGIEGQVTLRFVVDARGLVSDIEVLDSQPRGVFEKAARIAVSRWQYENPEQKPISQTVTLNFALEQP